MDLLLGGNPSIFDSLDFRPTAGQYGFRHSTAMTALAGVSEARQLLLFWRSWFGPPAVWHDGKLIDGRIRVAAWHSACMPGEYPRLAVATQRDAARALLLAGHADRAHAMLGDSIAYDGNTAALLRVPPEVGARLVMHARKLQKRVAKRQRPPRRRETVVVAVRNLYIAATEAGATISPEDLLEALGDWR